MQQLIALAFDFYKISNFTISKATFIIPYHFTTHLTSQTLFLP